MFIKNGLSYRISRRPSRLSQDHLKFRVRTSGRGRMVVSNGLLSSSSTADVPQRTVGSFKGSLADRVSFAFKIGKDRSVFLILFVVHDVANALPTIFS